MEDLCALIRESNEAVLDAQKWDSSDALKKHFFEQFKGDLPAAIDILSVDLVCQLKPPMTMPKVIRKMPC